MKPVPIVNKLWAQAEKLITPPQFAFVMVSEADGIVAFRHNCINGLPVLASALREFADKLDAGEARNFLTEVPKEENP